MGYFRAPIKNFVSGVPSPGGSMTHLSSDARKLQGQNRICVLDTPKTVLSHTLLQKETAITTRCRREHTYLRQSPDTEGCPLELGNIAELLYDGLFSMNSLVTIARPLTTSSNSILSRGNDFATLHKRCDMEKCIMRPVLLTSRHRGGVLVDHTLKQSS